MDWRIKPWSAVPCGRNGTEGKKILWGSGDMTHQLRALAAVPEESRSMVNSQHLRGSSLTVRDSSSRGSNTLTLMHIK